HSCTTTIHPSLVRLLAGESAGGALAPFCFGRVLLSSLATPRASQRRVVAREVLVCVLCVVFVRAVGGSGDNVCAHTGWRLGVFLPAGAGLSARANPRIRIQHNTDVSHRHLWVLSARVHGCCEARLTLSSLLAPSVPSRLLLA